MYVVVFCHVLFLSPQKDPPNGDAKQYTYHYRYYRAFPSLFLLDAVDEAGKRGHVGGQPAQTGAGAGDGRTLPQQRRPRLERLTDDVVDAFHGRSNGAAFPQNFGHRRVHFLPVQIFGRLKKFHAFPFPVDRRRCVAELCAVIEMDLVVPLDEHLVVVPAWAGHGATVACTPHLVDAFRQLQQKGEDVR